jgi:hypothetical protein
VVALYLDGEITIVEGIHTTVNKQINARARLAPMDLSFGASLSEFPHGATHNMPVAQFAIEVLAN